MLSDEAALLRMVLYSLAEAEGMGMERPAVLLASAAAEIWVVVEHGGKPVAVDLISEMDRVRQRQDKGGSRN